jgi:glycosyltransferase involved in cell wall biosynthesis
MVSGVLEYPNRVTLEPKVTVSVLAYNHEKFIEECLHGILRQQTSFEFEIILSEDNSTDKTRSICKRFAIHNQERIRLFLHDRSNVIFINGKPTGRFNMLFNIENARGKYIALCEGDDYWSDPHKLEKQVMVLDQKPEISICYHNVNIYHQKSKTMLQQGVERSIPNPSSFKELVDGNFIHTPSVLFRNEKLDLPQWFQHVPYGDYALYSILSLKGGIYKLDESMAVYRKHDQGSNATV